MIELSDYQRFIAASRYSRWIPEKVRREYWPESVHRYIEFFKSRYPLEGCVVESLTGAQKPLWEALEEAIVDLEVMPAMRSLMTAGKALDRDNAAGYNCSYIQVDDPRAFDEAMYLSMCGCGVGFSVERQFINQLPTIAEEFYPTDTVIVVADSRIGWATATRQLIKLLYEGLIPKWDLTRLREAGAVLRTFGGRSSGPEPLNRLFKFLVATFKEAAGRKLNSIECHDIMCMIANIVVCGGVRRSAMISLSNLSDDRMRNAKTGEWWKMFDHRRLSNNSVAYTEKPGMGIFMREGLSLYDSKSGERGIFNREGTKKFVKKLGRREHVYEFGTNPCGEINLRSEEFCNLTEIVVRPHDNFESLKRKVRLATILGTLQSTLTDFRYLRKSWQKNCEEERLLGVSVTGEMDNPIMRGDRGPNFLETILRELKLFSIETNAEFAGLLGINPSVAITCGKPSGTVSQLVGCASGMRCWHSPFLIRAVQNDNKDPITKFLIAQGVPHEPHNSTPNEVTVFYFPMKAPEGSKLRRDVTALDQLDLYLIYKLNWCEHNMSCTIDIREGEWLDVWAWVYRNFDNVGGLSFLPFADSDHIYTQAPYQEITEEEYNQRVAAFPKIDWSLLPKFEEADDSTTGAHEPACLGNQCEI